MYFGAPDSAAPWFSSLGYVYDSKADGLVSDWMLDLVSISFHKPSKPGVRHYLPVPEPSSTWSMRFLTLKSVSVEACVWCDKL